MIEVRNLRYRYGPEAEVLKGIDLRIDDGEYVGLVGSNGSGKSTLAKHLNALLRPTEGRVEVDGLSTDDEDRVAAIRQRVGMVFQNPDNQIVATIVEDDVAFGPENLGLSSEEIRDRVDEALATVHLERYREVSPNALSGGQKQRLAIAGVLAMRPAHMVVDEPTSMLDPVGRAEVRRVLARLHEEQGKTIIHITHLLDELLAADRVVALEMGELVFDGPRAEFFADRALLARLELEPPPLVEALWHLQELGVVGPLDPPSLEGLVDALCSSASKA